MEEWAYLSLVGSKTDRRGLLRFTGHGVTTLLRRSRSVYSLKHMSMPLICSRYCTPLLPYRITRLIIPDSAELEITVQLLVQIDKLVQLIESPVFTCTCYLRVTVLLVLIVEP